MGNVSDVLLKERYTNYTKNPRWRELAARAYHPKSL